ncbi:flavin-binding monooxygenase-like protein [Talaromyces proteolyticus]|uniref:Flavin-binding monooxygenase-like protein n=1 Tax=Talaromyces proteolyticus TaxID=1131652 RepID=A0AAD4L0I8_9EURO|nr:flavin-binding monooxygenase-like protein [Talaromyces proteolyticus]KAH8703486.1 flavin-binding monooxygenase-like protein [Talaromyces proteolyticus]
MAVEVGTVGTVPIVSKDRIEAGSINIPIGKLPTSVYCEDTQTTRSAGDIASRVIDDLNSALAAKNPQSVASLFVDNGYWRDHLGLSWDFRTLNSRQKIADFLAGGIRLEKVEIDNSSPFRAPHFGPIDGGIGEVKGVEFFINFTSDVGSGFGVARLAEVTKDQWEIFTFYTALQNLNGHEERLRHQRPRGVDHGGDPTRKNWQERRAAESNFDGKEPQVLIIGAGQGGLIAAARLKMLGVETLVIDREDRIGDNWRRRYRQLVLHDPVWLDHLPYIPFPPTWPIFTPKDKLADFFESYASLLELNVWTKTNLVSSSWDDDKNQWTVTLERQQHDGSKESRTFHPHHVILATGHSGKKNFPSFKGADAFQGDLLCHSSDFPGANPASKGKNAVVVGCCNSGHDIAQDFYEKGYNVTMVQRSSTLVISSNALVEVGLKGLYEEDGPPTEDADAWLISLPSEILKGQQIKVTKAQNQFDKNTLEGLKKAGFQVDMGPQDAGLFLKYFQRGGGYYIDVGASQLIVDGKIKIKQGQEISQVLANSIEFADGSTLPADEIVFATGYQNMHTEARAILGDALADRVGSVWGFDKEGEFRSMWRPSGHPAFWYMGGNLFFCRYYSKFLALQIKAIEEGIKKEGSR